MRDGLAALHESGHRAGIEDVDHNSRGGFERPASFTSQARGNRFRHAAAIGGGGVVIATAPGVQIDGILLGG
jgi:hypothetical protein